MMIGFYSLDLSCDEDGCTGWCARPRPPWQYTGHNEAACVRQARADGWRIGHKLMVCPMCSGKRQAPRMRQLELKETG